MSSFSERMRLRAQIAREAKELDPAFAGKSFIDRKKPPPQSYSVPSFTRRSEEKGKAPLKEINACNNVSPTTIVFPSVKPVSVSPPKPGCLYPCLTGMEVVPDTKKIVLNEDRAKKFSIENDAEVLEGSEDSDSSTDCVENFDIENTDSSFNDFNKVLKRRSSSDCSSSDENNILNEMDSFLEQALCSDTSYGPSPSKSACNELLGTSISTSFTYHEGSPIKEDSAPTLLLSVSFSRRESNPKKSVTSPKEAVSKEIEGLPIKKKETDQTSDATHVSTESTMKKLQSLVQTQENIISQASQALLVCFSSPDFMNSTQRVEAERLLLIASLKKKAVLSEIEKLKKNPSQSEKETVFSGSSLTISDICLPIKSDLIHRATKANTCHYLVGVMQSKEYVFSTTLVTASKENLHQNSRKIVYVKFPNKITLPEISPDFKVTIEIYDLVIPVSSQDGKSRSSGKKESCKLWITPKKPKQRVNLRKAVSRSVLKSSNFKLIGFGHFTLNDVKSSQINLTKMSVPNLLEGTIYFRSNCDVTAAVEYHGFLTMFNDNSDFGAWHRMWCYLNGSHLLYWKYPEDEGSEEAIGSIDLSACISTNVSAASRDVCARPNTILIECARPTKSFDFDSQLMVRRSSQRVVRYLLSADSRESREEWCKNFNAVLSTIQKWKRPSTNKDS